MSEELVKLARRFNAALRSTFKNTTNAQMSQLKGLTPAQVFMMHHIQEENPCTVSHLASKMEVNPSAITAMIDRLESHGYVMRSRAVDDRRVVYLQLTDEGELALQRTTKLHEELVRFVLSQIREDEVLNMILTLEKVEQISRRVDMKEIAKSI